jgi:hypothetical protein
MFEERAYRKEVRKDYVLVVPFLHNIAVRAYISPSQSKQILSVLFRSLYLSIKQCK